MSDWAQRSHTLAPGLVNLMTKPPTTAINLRNAPSPRLTSCAARARSSAAPAKSPVAPEQSSGERPKIHRQVRLKATATKEASATTAVVARILAVILSVREILEWSAADQLVDTVVSAARNPRIVVKSPARRAIRRCALVQQFRAPSESLHHHRTANLASRYRADA
jgi:hypothetical protein